MLCREIRLYSCNGPKPGAIIQNFMVKDIKKLRDYDAEATLLQHTKFGTQHLHVRRPSDSNNVFVIGLPTFPENDKGIPHILEHCVLCGSNKFPVRDPFFKMLNRSLASFMNAWTFPDMTLYPFSSMNVQDCKSLRDVYFDAVFRPSLKKLDFLQEGWRLERPNDGAPWQFMGVVFNEMKGALSDASSIFSTKLQQFLFKGTPYGFVSGGDPLHIPRLSHQELVAFHRKFYHISQAKFFSYGDIPLQEHLAYLDDQIRQLEGEGFAPQAKVVFPVGSFRPEESIRCPISFEGPIDTFSPAEKQHKFSMTVFLPELRDENVQELFHLQILSYLLIDGPASPMYKALIDPKFGSDYVAGTGLDTSTRWPTFTIGLEGLESDMFDVVQESIHRVFKDVADSGFPAERIQAALHIMEISRKHISAKFGLALAQSCFHPWIHGMNPLEFLHIEDRIVEFQRLLSEDPALFQGLVRKYFLAGKWYSAKMHPSELYQRRLESEEASILSERSSTITTAQSLVVDEENGKLKALQGLQEDLSCLPCLSIGDISEKLKRPIVWKETSQSGVKYYVRQDATNDIYYVKGIRDWFTQEAADVAEHALLSPLMFECLTMLPTENLSADQLDEKMKLTTGGVSIDHWSATNIYDRNKLSNGYYFQTSCLQRNFGEAVNLVKEILLHTSFSKEPSRIQTTVLSLANTLVSGLADAGPSYAKRYAMAILNPKLYLRHELQFGLTQVSFINALARKINDINFFDEVSMYLGSLYNKTIVGAGDLRMSIVEPTNSMWDVFEPFAPLDCKINAFPPESMQPPFMRDLFPNFRVVSSTNTFFLVPFPVASTALVFDVGIPWMHPDSSRLSLIATIISNKFLHQEIREKNGAYGSGISYSAFSGHFVFYSYRDPLPLHSVERSFPDSISWFLENASRLTDQDLLEAKLTIFKELDAPQDISNLGMARFNYDISNDMLEQRRASILSCSLQDLSSLASKYFTTNPGLLDKNLWKKNSRAVIIGGGQKENLEIILKGNVEWTINRLEFLN